MYLLAEFLYQRDGRDQPSLNSYMQQREDAQLTPRTEDKVSAKTSPLATTCCTAVTSALDIGKGFSDYIYWARTLSHLTDILLASERSERDTIRSK